MSNDRTEPFRRPTSRLRTSVSGPHPEWQHTLERWLTTLHEWVRLGSPYFVAVTVTALLVAVTSR